MTITLSHGGPTIYRSAAPSRQVLVGTIEGVVHIERDPSGPAWHVADRTLTDKHVHAILIEPDSGTVFAGMKHGSLFASEDGGRTWELRDKGLTEHNVYSLACTRLGGVAGPSFRRSDRSTRRGGAFPPRRTSRTPSTSTSIRSTPRPCSSASSRAGSSRVSTQGRHSR